MHEVMAAQNILTAIMEETAKRTARPVAAKISCGRLCVINDESLCFAFEAVAKGTLCEGMKLEIEHKPIQGQCKSCNQSFDVEWFDRLTTLSKLVPSTVERVKGLSSPRCPKCGSEDFQLLPDVPLVLEEIEFQPE